MSWTEENIAIVRDLWAKGHSASEIAKKLGPDVTRNMVIGKVTRLKLGRRIQPGEGRYSAAALFQGHVSSGRLPFLPPTGERKKRLPPPDAPYVNRETIVTPLEKCVGIDALEQYDGRCRYAHGETTPFKFCGARTIPTTSWCPVHFRVVTGAPHPSHTQIDEVFAEPGKNPAELEAVS